MLQRAACIAAAGMQQPPGSTAGGLALPTQADVPAVPCCAAGWDVGLRGVPHTQPGTGCGAWWGSMLPIRRAFHTGSGCPAACQQASPALLSTCVVQRVVAYLVACAFQCRCRCVHVMLEVNCYVVAPQSSSARQASPTGSQTGTMRT